MRNIKFLNETITIQDEESRCIDTAKYNFRFNTLDVKYKNNSCDAGYINYRYWDVSPVKFLELMECESTGKYINIIIKPLHEVTKKFIKIAA